jgi:hypothetical protein
MLAAYLARCMVAWPAEFGSAGDPPRKAQVVPDHGARTRLSADRHGLDHQGAQSLRGAVHRGCQARRSGAHYREVIELRSGLRRDPKDRGDLGEARVVQDGAVMTDHGRKTAHVDAELSN